ncbi:ABC transporter ATP-binding protein [Peptostreptococcaceae bacterium AGR-M142]
MEINFNNISKKFNNNLVLKNLNFTIKTNRINCIVGKNGAGKTTLVKGLSGLLIFDDFDNISINKKLYNINFLHKNVSTSLGESRNLYLNLTLMQNIKYNLSLYSLKYNDKKNKIDYYLKLFKIENFENTIISKLSKGTKQKLSLIITLIKNSKILIFDEPDTGLDFESLNIFKKIIEREKKDRTVIITSHNIDLIQDVADNIIILSNGVIDFCGNIYDFENNQNSKIILELSFENILSKKSEEILKLYSKNIEFKNNIIHISINKNNIHEFFDTILKFGNKIIDIKTKNLLKNSMEEDFFKERGIQENA